MSALEQEIVEKFQQLEPAAKRRVLEMLFLSAQSSFDYDDWWGRVEVLQAGIRLRLGEGATVGALSLLDELREEES